MLATVLPRYLLGVGGEEIQTWSRGGHDGVVGGLVGGGDSGVEADLEEGGFGRSAALERNRKAVNFPRIRHRQATTDGQLLKSTDGVLGVYF